MVLGKRSLGEVMEEWRTDLGLSKSAMAKHLGISRCGYMRAIKPGANPRMKFWFPLLQNGYLEIHAIAECPTISDHFHISSIRSERAARKDKSDD